MAEVHACAGFLLRKFASTSQELYAFFDCMSRSCMDLVPKKYGCTEPPEHVLNALVPITFDGYGKSSMVWTARRGDLQGLMTCNNREEHTCVFVWGGREHLEAVDIQSWIRAAQSCFIVDWAYIHLLTTQEVHKYKREFHRRVSPFNSGVVSKDIQKAIPNLPWVAVFGSAYVELIGLDNLLQCDAHRVEQWDDVVLVQTSEDLKGIDSAFDAFDERRNIIKRRIGAEFFFLGMGRDAEQRRPDFGIEGVQ